MTVTNRRRTTINSNRIVQQFNNIADHSTEPTTEYPLSHENDYFPFPKHLPFPQVPHNSELFNELYLFVFSIMCTALQFIHLYRTTFWLPGSSHTTVNFYLIDKYLAYFILIMSSRRLVYCLLEKSCEFVCPKQSLEMARVSLKYSYLVLLISLLLVCSFKILQKYSLLYIICLSYPLILYIFIFRLRIDPFLKINSSDSSISMINGFPMHSCSINAHSIRTEIEALKNDFNNRFKQVVFTSVLNAYYAGFIPLCFVNRHLYFDKIWATQHLTFAFLGALTASLAYCFPVRYSDVLHRASLHLGIWHKTSTRNHPPPIPWNKSIVWPFGTYVKYAGDVYRSNSNSTCATPANNSHYRFYTIFKNPSNLYSIMATVQAIIVLIQLLLLITCSEWQNVLSLSFLILFNFYTLFKLLRDFLIAKSIYSAETAVNEKLKSGNM